MDHICCYGLPRRVRCVTVVRPTYTTANAPTFPHAPQLFSSNVGMSALDDRALVSCSLSSSCPVADVARHARNS
eukprot:11165769-Lingulodinium_polyedra.AAC.1